MYNTKFILESGRELYPGYLDKEQRQELKNQYAGKRAYMRCGCKPTDSLYYRISEDLRIYPEHNNYQHDMYCCRYRDISGNLTRQAAYIINEEDGNVTAYTSFNPKVFSMTEDTDKEFDNTIPEDDTQEEILVEKSDEIVSSDTQKKEPNLSLEGLIRSINVDSFTEKIVNSKNIDSKEKFSVFVYYRMKKVNLYRAKKSIGDLTLEKDGVRFVYSPFVAAAKKTDNGITRCYVQTKDTKGNTYNNFTYPEILERAMKKFYKTYGIEPNENTVMAGFQYIKKNKAGTNTYKVMGRIHIFQTSDLGLYCRDMNEVYAFNTLHQIVRENREINFWIPPEDDSLGAIIDIKGKKKKVLLLFRTQKDERISYDPALYVPFVMGSDTEITKDTLYELLNE